MLDDVDVGPEVPETPETREARAFVAALLADGAADHDPDPAAALPVPEADARTVVREARRLAQRGLSGSVRPVPDEGLTAVAEALVVDEHPSAHRWSEGERREAVRWVALLIERFGEDGVQELIMALARKAEQS